MSPPPPSSPSSSSSVLQFCMFFFSTGITSVHVLTGSAVSVRRHQTSNTSQVGVGEHGVFLPHCAEPFDGVHKLLIVHELLARKRHKFDSCCFCPKFCQIPSTKFPTVSPPHLCPFKCTRSQLSVNNWLEVKPERELRTKATLLEIF